MSLQKFRPVLEALAVAAPLYLLHEWFFYLLGISQHTFVKQLGSIYGFFVAFSVAMLLLLVFVKEKSFDNVGMVCLILTTIQMVVAYAVFSPILKSSSGSGTFEKFNFLGVFGAFLTVQTIVVIRMLKNR